MNFKVYITSKVKKTFLSIIKLNHIDAANSSVNHPLLSNQDGNLKPSPEENIFNELGK